MSKQTPSEMENKAKEFEAFKTAIKNVKLTSELSGPIFEGAKEEALRAAIEAASGISDININQTSSKDMMKSTSETHESLQKLHGILKSMVQDTNPSEEAIATLQEAGREASAVLRKNGA